MPFSVLRLEKHDQTEGDVSTDLGQIQIHMERNSASASSLTSSSTRTWALAIAVLPSTRSLAADGDVKGVRNSDDADRITRRADGCATPGVPRFHRMLLVPLGRRTAGRPLLSRHATKGPLLSKPSGKGALLSSLSSKCLKTGA